MKAALRAAMLVSMLVPTIAPAQATNAPIAAATGQGGMPAAPEGPAGDRGGEGGFEGAADAAWTGHSDAAITILVFSDYGCASCVKVERALDRVERDRRGELLIVHHDFPVSGTDSIAASLDLLRAFNEYGVAAWRRLRAGLIAGGVSETSRAVALEASGVAAAERPDPAAMLALFRGREIAKRAGVPRQPALIVMNDRQMVPLAGDFDERAINAAIERLSGRHRRTP